MTTILIAITILGLLISALPAVAACMVSSRISQERGE